VRVEVAEHDRVEGLIRLLEEVPRVVDDDVDARIVVRVIGVSAPSAYTTRSISTAVTSVAPARSAAETSFPLPCADDEHSPRRMAQRVREVEAVHRIGRARLRLHRLVPDVVHVDPLSTRRSFW
jgi:hypothetical protein